MKAWKMGAIVGAVIGLLKVSASVLFPVIGAVVGSVLFHSIFTFITTTKLKLWQKGGIVGAVWGFESFVIGAYVGMANEASIVQTSIFENLLSAPLFINLYLGIDYYQVGRLFNVRTATANDIGSNLWLITTVLIGIFIGALFGYVYEKRGGSE